MIIKKRSDSSYYMKNLSNMPKNVTFQMVFVKYESGRIRVHPQPLYRLCIIINTTYISILRMNTNRATFVLHENRLKFN